MAPKATIMRTEDDATAAAAYLSGQAELFATNTLIIPDLQKRNPEQGVRVKFDPAQPRPHGRAHGRDQSGCAGSTASSSSTP
jgi:hypothetical protein